MIDFPKIKGIKWLSIDSPDLISVKILLEDKNQREKNELLGMLVDIPVETIESNYYIDLSKLAGIRDFYPTESEIPSSTECFIDVEGIRDSFIVTVPKGNLLEAWIFYKKHK